MYPAKAALRTGSTPFAIDLAPQTGDAPSPNKTLRVGAGERFEVVEDNGARLLVRAQDRSWYAWVYRAFVDLDPVKS